MERGDYEQCKRLIDAKNPSELLFKVIELLSNQVTKNCRQRQLKLLDEYLILSRYGFFLRDIKHLMILLDLLIKPPYMNDFKPQFRNIINIGSLPPLLNKSTDVLLYSKELEEYFNTLAFLVVDLDSDSEMQQLTARTIMELLTDDYPELKYYTPLIFRFKAAESGTFPDILGELLGIIKEASYPILLKIVYQLARNSEISCRKLIEQFAISSIFRRLDPLWRQSHCQEKYEFPEKFGEIQNYEDASKLLWLLLNYMSKNDDLKKPKLIPDNTALRGLQYAFWYFCKKHNAVDRNNILAIILQCLDIFPKVFKHNTILAFGISRIFESDMIKKITSTCFLDIAMLMAEGDVPFVQNHWTKKVKLDATDDDYVFMIMLMMCMYYFDAFFSGIRILEECGVLHALLTLIKQNQRIQWRANHYCPLLCLALSLLKKIVPSLCEEFLEYGGTYSLIKIIKYSIRKKSDIQIVVKCLETMDYLVKRSKTIKESLQFNNGIFTILGLCEELLIQPLLNWQFQRCLWYSISLLQQLCTSPWELLGTIPFTISYLKRITKPKASDPVIDPRVTILLINYLWDNVLIYQKCTRLFIRMGGVFTLLDLIEMSCYPVQLVSLGVLVDLCEDGDCIPYVITWRKNGKKIIPVLMKIFRASNTYHQIKSGPCGEIVDVNFPLMGIHQFHETYCACMQESKIPSMLDIVGSCRPKIYAILQMLTYRHEEQLRIANETYAMFNNEYSVEDRVTLLLAENFLTLKLGEAWREVKFGLEKLGVVPIASDRAVLETLIEKSVMWGTILRDMQFELMRVEYEKDLYAELELYESLKEPRIMEALDGIKELKYISRCVERMFRISASLVQTNQAVKSMMKYQDNSATIHKTYMTDVLLTPMFCQIMDIYDDTSKATRKEESGCLSMTGLEEVSPHSSIALYLSSETSGVNLTEPFDDNEHCK